MEDPRIVRRLVRERGPFPFILSEAKELRSSLRTRPQRFFVASLLRMQKGWFAPQNDRGLGVAPRMPKKA